ncbi:putative Glutamyl-tRNA amidotransferase subunit A [Xylogone sp. PMI_703]|nr:putative Glutamyl-tRNA amidotransferase subunit A [Xylogone sp. PMI_703]
MLSFLRPATAAALALAMPVFGITMTQTPAGDTLVVNGISYYAAPNAVTTIDLSSVTNPFPSDVPLVPLTVIADSSSLFDVTAFRAIAANYSASDDVFNPGFLETVYLTHVGSSPANVKYPLGAALTQYNTKLFMPSRAYTSSVQSQGNKIVGWRTAIPPGPYFMSPISGEVFQAYRLYSDVQGAFTSGIIANGDGTYSTLSAAISGAQSQAIGVPSRLYYTKTTSQPLAGVRIGIKDIYDIAGIKSSLGNRAYFDLYPPRTATAVSVQRLIDAGAVLIGKMKTSQFANGETATADWVDYHSPFNARGDGYQDPSSSSSGPGAAMGSYDWVDIALGSDTGGSIRNPSQVNGCFGNRPSHGLVALDGVMPLSPDLDTAGFLCRDPVLWHDAAKVLYGTNITSSNYKSFPKKLLTSGFPTAANSEAQSLILDFLAKLEDFLGVNATAVTLDPIWNANPPAEAGSQSIGTYLNLVYPTLISQQQYELVALPFYADYAAAHGGARPFIDPSPLIRWGYGQTNLPANATESALAAKAVFTDWFAENVVVPDPDTCSDSFFLYVGTSGSPNYRNTYRSAPGVPTGFSTSRISNFAGIPDMVVPIGQAPYNSTISLQTEYLPVAIDFMVAKGCDGMVFDLVKKLVDAGIVKVPGVGSVMY